MLNDANAVQRFNSTQGLENAAKSRLERSPKRAEDIRVKPKDIYESRRANGLHLTNDATMKKNDYKSDFSQKAVKDLTQKISDRNELASASQNRVSRENVRKLVKD